MTGRTPHIRDLLVLATVATLVVGGVAVFSTGAVAQSDDDTGLFEPLTNDEDDGLPGGLACVVPGDNTTIGDCNDQVLTSLAATSDRVQFRATSLFSDDASRAEQAAADLTETYNSNNQTLETYVNERFSGDAEAYNVIEIEFRVGDSTATRYLVADVTNETFENSTMTNSTDRTVDKRLGLSGLAATESDAELQRFVDEYASEDRDPDKALYHRMTVRYGGLVDLPEGVSP